MCRLTARLTEAGLPEDNTINNPHLPDEYIAPQNQDHVGNMLELLKNTEWTRFLFQNPNGVSIGSGGDIETVLEHAQAMGCDHFVLPETKLDTDKKWVKAKMHNHCRRIFGVGQYRAVMAASNLEYSTNYKPGGVLGVTVGHLTGRVIETGSDPMGRWVYTKFNASGDRNVTVIGIYQPCDQNVKTTGSTTATTKQHSMLQQEGRHNPHRVRHHFAQDLCKFVKDCKNNKELVVVGGDFNETLGDSMDGLTKLCNDCGLVDVHSSRHGTDTHTFNTHIRGSKCIDYVLADPDLMASVQRCGYEPFRIRILGDHRGVYMDVNTRMFFGSDTIPMAPPKSRHL